MEHIIIISIVGCLAVLIFTPVVEKILDFFIWLTSPDEDELKKRRKNHYEKRN